MSSGSESGSVTQECRKELKKSRKGESSSQFDKNRSIHIEEAQPNKPGSGQSTKKGETPSYPGPSKTPAKKTVPPAVKTYADRLKEQRKKEDKIGSKQGDSRVGGSRPDGSAPLDNEIQSMKCKS